MRRLLPILLLLSFACGSSSNQRPATVPQPDFDAGLVNPLFFGSGTSAPATIEVRIHNRAKVPIVVRRIELDSPGMGQYTLIRIVREFRETVGPGETKAVTVFATAIARTTRNPTEPLTIRAIIEMQAEGKSWREMVLIRG
jgi:hypothetical protein